MNQINKKILKSKKAMNSEKYKSANLEKDKALLFFSNQDEKIREEKLRKGLYRNKDNILEIKIRTYVKDENRIREIFEDLNFIPKNKVYDARGKKKEYQHSYPAKSQWKWRMEEEERKGKRKPEIQEVYETCNEKIEIPKSRKAIILFDGENIGFYEGFINGFEPEEIETYLWKDDAKINSKVRIKKWDRKGDPKKKIRYGSKKITLNDLIKTEIHLCIPVYELLEVENIIIH